VSRKRGRTFDENSIEARLQAIGYLLDREGYIPPGLCILGVEEGFVVHGLQEAGDRHYALQTLTVEQPTLASAIKRLRA
jgi:hypothetical protein